MCHAAPANQAAPTMSSEALLSPGILVIIKEHLHGSLKPLSGAQGGLPHVGQASHLQAGRGERQGWRRICGAGTPAVKVTSPPFDRRAALRIDEIVDLHLCNC